MARKKRETTKNLLSAIVHDYLTDTIRVVIDGEVDTDTKGNYLINVGYIRVSTDKQADEGFGLEVQENEVVNYCKTRHFSNLLLFVDDGYTGTNLNRPALQAIMSMIDSYNDGYSDIRINTMIVPKIDRLSRSMFGTLEFIDSYIVSVKDSKSGRSRNIEDINFVSVQENYCRVDKDIPSSKLMLQLFATLAEYDRDTIVEKLNNGKVARVAKGYWPGPANTPFGYVYNKDTGILDIVEEDAAKVKEVYRLYIDLKHNPQQIANELGFKTDGVVRMILKHKSLTGVIEYKGKEYKGKHTPIISTARWEQAQREFEVRGTVRGKNEYLLTGLLFCAECGAKLRYQKWTKDGRYKVYCYSQQTTKKYLVRNENCKLPKLWADEVESIVLSGLFAMANKLDTLNNNTDTAYVDSTEVLEKTIAKLERELSNYYNIAATVGMDDVLMENINKCKNKINKTKEQIIKTKTSKEKEQAINNLNTALLTMRDGWDRMSLAEQHDIMIDIIDKVLIHADGEIEIVLRVEQQLQMA